MSASSASATVRGGSPAVEAVLNGQVVDEATIAKAEAAASAAVDPQDDIHASAAYRRALVGTDGRARAAERGRLCDCIRWTAMPVRFEVNGKQVEVEVEPRLTLADCLRHHLRLTGTHVGCEHGVCGACTVHRRRRRGALLPDAGGAGRGRQGGDRRRAVRTTTASRRCRHPSASITRCSAASARPA